jgi:predicted PhzF superfamily epimerase YddE/YHI9
LSNIIKCNGYYGFIVDSQGSDILVHYKLINYDNSLFLFKAKQGEAIKRLGIVEVEVIIENNETVEVKISGNAVIVSKSELSLG